MIECETMKDARAVKDAVLIVLGKPITVYQRGDDIPESITENLRAVREQPEPPSELEQLKARIAALEARGR